MKLPQRTRISKLADNDLILLDFMFDATVPRPMLEDEKFSIHNNTSYSHEFDTLQLNKVLNRLLDQELLFTERHKFREEKVEYYGLTSTGGKLWESERKPVWKRYVEDSQELAEQKGVWATTISSYSEEALFACVEYYVKNSFMGVPISELKYAQSNSSSLIYWKNNSVVYKCQFLAKEKEDVERTDWGKYKQNRVWWRNVCELQRYFA